MESQTLQGKSPATDGCQTHRGRQPFTVNEFGHRAWYGRIKEVRLKVIKAKAVKNFHKAANLQDKSKVCLNHD